MELNIHEKRTIFQILTLIMKADSVTRTEEIDMLDRIFREYQLTLDEFDHMDDIDSDCIINRFKGFSEEKKEYARALFLEMASCDGNVDPRERLLIESLG